MANNISLSHSWHFAIGAYNNDVWVANFGQDSSFAGAKTAQGNQDSGGIGDFYYTPPTGYLALCTSNLPAVAVTPSENFNTVLYTGNGSTQSITGVGFQPDLLVGKARSDGNHTAVYDAIRGVQVELNWSGDPADRAATNGVTAFGADGFSVGSHDKFNRSGTSMVAWSWKANGSGSANTDGNMAETVTVSANTDAGFSIVTYTGDGSAATVGHGLSKAPEWIYIKRRSGADSWRLYHKDIGLNGSYPNFMQPDLTTAVNSGDSGNFTAAPSATVFSIGDYSVVNSDDETYIAYCFHSVDGYSKVGSYEGNGNADGTFVFTGFRPAMVITKPIDATGNWNINDSVRSPDNVVDERLKINSSAAESDSDALDFTSNGFKVRHSGTSYNQSGYTYIYLAFAETPFKYANAR
jgi:hypothetical protein